LRPDEEATYEFRLNIPLYFGNQEENFVLINLEGTVYTGSDFTLSLEINRIEADVVEVLDTETGTLNVRDKASGFGNIVTTVLPGQRFIELERTSTGWVKIDLEGDEFGWVSARYVKRI
jgi:hypothetical protein